MCGIKYFIHEHKEKNEKKHALMKKTLCTGINAATPKGGPRKRDSMDQRSRESMELARIYPREHGTLRLENGGPSTHIDWL